MLKSRPVALYDRDVDALLVACGAGDADALGSLYAGQGSRLYAVAMRLLRDRATADEVLQETFLQIWSNAARFDPARGSGIVWMLSLLRYRALDRLRTRCREDLSADPDLGDMAEPAQALERLMSAEDTAALGRCLAALDENNRGCILMAYLDGCSHSEVAVRLALPLGTVKSRIRRSLMALKTCLSST